MNGRSAAALDTTPRPRYDVAKAVSRCTAHRPAKYSALFYSILKNTQNSGHYQLDAKRTILTAMIDRVEVSRDCKILIQVNLTMQQFLGEVVAA